MSDTIERRAAIDAVCSVCGNDCDKSKFVYDTEEVNISTVYSSDQKAIEAWNRRAEDGK